jgi:hypothetical protein
MDICMYWKINVLLTMRKSLQLTNLKSFVHAIMIYASTQWKNKNKDNDDPCKRNMLFHLNNFKISLKLKIQKPMQCEHNNNNIQATTSSWTQLLKKNLKLTLFE